MPKPKAPPGAGAPIRTDGRRAMLVYMRPDLIIDVKKAALDLNLNAFEIVERAVFLWLKSRCDMTPFPQDQSAAPPLDAHPNQHTTRVAKTASSAQGGEPALKEEGAPSLQKSRKRSIGVEERASPVRRPPEGRGTAGSRVHGLVPADPAFDPMTATQPVGEPPAARGAIRPSPSRKRNAASAAPSVGDRGAAGDAGGASTSAASRTDRRKKGPAA